MKLDPPARVKKRRGGGASAAVAAADPPGLLPAEAGGEEAYAGVEAAGDPAPPGAAKKPWSAEEDELLKLSVAAAADPLAISWMGVAPAVSGRSAKQCRGG